jgi:hypothetical protein
MASTKKGKKERKNLSLFSGEAGRFALGRFPGLGFFYSPRLPMSPRLTVAWLRLSLPSQWRDHAGFAPDFPMNPEL